MKRKLVQHGLSSLITTLPSKWVDDNNLKRGDEIDVIEKGDSLIISASPNKIKKSLSLDMNNKKFLKRYINSAYISGFDEIEIQISNSFSIKGIKEAVSELIGYEIVDQSSKKILVQILSNENDNIDNVVRRIFHLLSTISKQLFSDDIAEIEELDSLVNKLRFFCSRQINKMGYGDRNKDTYVFLQLSRIEEACDEYKILAKMFLDNRKLQVSTSNISKKISNYIVKVSNEYFKPNTSNLPSIKKLRNEIIQDIYVESNKGKKSEVYLHFYTIMHIVRHIESTIDYEDTSSQRE